MNARSLLLLACGCSGLLLCAVGCERRALQAAPAEPPAVPVSLPVRRDVTENVDFTGRTQAVNSVNIVARATGYLVLPPGQKELFKEGSDVKKGELLFQIDPRPYEAQYKQALAQVNLYKAQLNLSRANLARDEQAMRNTPGSVSLQQLDQDRAAVAQAEAQVKAAEASADTYKINLDFCSVTSPIDGQVSRYYFTLGNLATQDQTLLTTVVSLDPIYAYVDVDEPTVLRVRRAINEGRIKPYPSGHIPILMGLQDEKDFPHKGVIDFVNNQVNPTTGTILARGVFDNPLPPGGRRLIMPGMYVRIRLPIGQPYPRLLVVDRAIGSDQDKKYVYVVNPENNKIEYRPVTIGPMESDGLRVITKGLNADDKVVVSGLQQVHTGMEVRTDLIPMPVLDGQGAGALPAGSVPGGPVRGGPAAEGASPAGSGAAGKIPTPAADNQGAAKK